VLSVSPEQNEPSAPRDTDISATFSENMEQGSPQTFVVHGSLTGALPGTYTGDGTTVLGFEPISDLFPGEKIQTSLTQGLQQSGIGQPFLNNDVVWEFTSAVRPGVASFPSGSDVSGDQFSTTEVALGDFNGDGDLDLIAGNFEADNQLFLNNGTSSPFSGVSSFEISGTFSTHSIAIGDVDRDGDLDLVDGTNPGYVNYYYLNNGTSNPFSAVSATALNGAKRDTFSVVLGDVDGDSPTKSDTNDHQHPKHHSDTNDHQHPKHHSHTKRDFDSPSSPNFHSVQHS
jgi:VCBS repeat protein/Big-like domain-containing protein